MIRKPSTGQCGVIYIRRIPAALKKQFKALCAQLGISMSQAIEDFMRDVIRRKGTKK